MGWVPPPRDPNATPAELAAHRAMLVRALGYDPAVGPPGRWHFAGVWAAIAFVVVVWAVGLVVILSL